MVREYDTPLARRTLRRAVVPLGRGNGELVIELLEAGDERRRGNPAALERLVRLRVNVPQRSFGLSDAPPVNVVTFAAARVDDVLDGIEEVTDGAVSSKQ